MAVTKVANSNANVKQVTDSELSGSVPTPPVVTYLPIRNYLLNSNLQWWQQFGSTASFAANASVTYAADQMFIRNITGPGSSVSCNRVASTLPGSYYGAAAKMFTAPTSSPVAGTSAEIWFLLDNTTSRYFLSQGASFAVQVKGVANINQVSVQFFYATGESLGILNNAISVPSTFAINSSGFTNCTITAAIPSTMTANGILAMRIAGSGVSTGNTYDVNNGIVVEQPMLNLGLVPFMWQPAYQDAGLEFRALERYYQQTYFVDTIPGTPTTTNCIEHIGEPSNSQQFFYPFRTVMRASPIITLYSISGAPNVWYDVNSALDRAMGIENGGDRAQSVFVSGGTAGNHIMRGHIVADARIH